jgi:hypothetical protein
VTIDDFVPKMLRGTFYCSDRKAIVNRVSAPNAKLSVPPLKSENEFVELPSKERFRDLGLSASIKQCAGSLHCFIRATQWPRYPALHVSTLSRILSGSNQRVYPNEDTIQSILWAFQAFGVTLTKAEFLYLLRQAHYGKN